MMPRSFSWVYAVKRIDVITGANDVVVELCFSSGIEPEFGCSYRKRFLNPESSQSLRAMKKC